MRSSSSLVKLLVRGQLPGGSLGAHQTKCPALQVPCHLVGGAAITEELRPGFQFTTFSYALSLLRPQIVQELERSLAPGAVAERACGPAARLLLAR